MKNRLDIAIATFRPSGIERLATNKLPKIEGVRYVVSWQDDQEYTIPQSIATRNDMEVFRFKGKGQSANRNNSIEHCSAEIILIADDDVTYIPQGLKELIRFYDLHPEVDLCTVKVERPGLFAWPDCTMRLSRHLPKNYAVGAYELSFRKQRIGNLRFHPDFGLNSPKMHCGEDSLFLLTAIRRKLTCFFTPILIGIHPHESTGVKIGMSAAILKGQGCLIKFHYPYSFPLRIPLKAWRLWRNGNAGFFKSLRYLTVGAFIGIKMLMSNDRSLLW